MKNALFATAAAVALMLAACGEKPVEEAAAPPAAEPAAAPAAEPAAPAPPSPQQVIETRQANLKDMGANFKTINDQSKAGTPDMAAITAAADKIKGYSVDIGTWFPAGTGAEAGIKTAALPKIWEDQATFQAAVAKFQAEASAMQTAAASGDVAQVKAQFPKTGGSCKNCHDNFRAKDEDKK
jgi:cytochrome c556